MSPRLNASFIFWDWQWFWDTNEGLRVQGFEDHATDGHCLACGGRGWFADDMMGTSLTYCRACNSDGDQ